MAISVPYDIIEAAEREIAQTYGHRVSFAAKAKYLKKFGRTDAASASAVVTVAEFQDAVVNETYATTNSADPVFQISTYIIIPPNSDVRMVAGASASASVEATMEGPLGTIY